MPDPYRTLGLPPTADTADAEVAFRRLLKDAHPDRHIGEPEAVVAEASRRTRELTEAISAIRAGWRPPSQADAWGEGLGFRAADDTDWFGNPLTGDDRPAAIACPFCGEPFGFLADYDLHLVSRHGAHVAPRPRRGTNRLMHWLRFLPLPSLTLLIVMVLWWMLVVRLAPPALERVGIWVGVIGFLLLRGMVHHAQRHRL